MSHKSLKVAVLGAGNVGAQVARLLLADADSFAQRAGARLDLIGVAVRTVDSPRTVDLPAELYTTDAATLVEQADLVVELIGGIEPAKSLIIQAIQGGASVITGNKALLASHGAELYALADAAGVQLSYEAAVAGAIPILRPIRDSLAGDQIHRVLGIVNGTTNYILDQMDTTGADFATALAQAQQLGYAEADPTADVAGQDAAAKAAILATLAFHGEFDFNAVYCEGITAVTAEDIQAAADAGLVIKLLAITERVPASEANDGGISARVHPTLLPREHPLASVHGAYNAVYIEAESAGDLMFYGAGAGGVPTASAVLGDLVSAARRIVRGGPGRTERASESLNALPITAVETRYSVGIQVKDEPGVLAKIAQVLSDHGVSIETLRQRMHPGGPGTPASADLRVVTHRATEAALAATIEEVRGLDVVTGISSVLRVEGTD